jgi:hypothetical protein
LKQFAEATGGRSYLPEKNETLEEIVEDISCDLANAYAVTLTSERTIPTGQIYKLEVRCANRDFVVNAPREYSERKQ